MLRDQSNAQTYLEQIRTEFPHAQLVHRIDKPTSGVLLAAKHAASKRALSRSFANQEIKKFYVCVVTGHIPTNETLEIRLPLKAGRKSKYRVAGLREEIRAHRTGWSIESQEGFKSITRIRVLLRGPNRTLLVCQPVTGRTHQLRVHLAWIGHAIVGDLLYGAVRSAEQQWERLALHAHLVRLPQIEIAISAPVPQTFYAATRLGG